MAKRPGQITSCVFDLETSSLNADFGIVLCGVILPASGKPRILRADDYPAWQEGRRSDDSGIVADLAKVLADYDIWIAHNGARFDVPYLRTRAIANGLPPIPPAKIVDPLWLARNKLRLGRNTLEAVAELTGANLKDRVAPRYWLRATLDGDKESLDYIVRHCVKDVRTLEKVVGSVKTYATTLNAWGSGY